MKYLCLSNTTKRAKVDNEDYPLLSRFCWFYDPKWNRAYTTIMTKNVSLSRFIMPPHGAKLEVDHMNRDGLDNRKSNLRICTRIENEMNKTVRKNTASGFKGVTWNHKNNTWRARLKKDGKFLHLGLFKNKKDAAKAYNEKAKEIYGGFAWLNPV